MLPLFQGMSRNDIENVVAHTRLGFSKHGKNKVVINEGKKCVNLCFLMQGEMEAVTNAYDGSYSIGETFGAPAMIQPECLFGLKQIYTKTFIATTECRMVYIGKNEVTKLMAEFDIFRINMLNILCTKVQRLSHMQWQKPPQDIRRKIFAFVEKRCQTAVGHKTMKIKMEVLAEQIGESRINVSSCLAALENEGLLKHSRATMDIPALERLNE
ncbi:Crp/Fnr family transcriptional regulator [Prevotella sp. OH937_COT-195]|uniref:Crp/Fnr family transcriptional regulator n=1 Tax=Prevotella sp. OH937_COT-195 TaxID=2491051 RepID=UPI000F64EE56|nr:Crp/Fnr family transcriptional regulator [Prevotella sp. OH937_COT-195]RRD03006.1 Crp/Fnr family transcriptional regulator [Prevotella sp. OH937_COT-195]